MNLDMFPVKNSKIKSRPEAFGKLVMLDGLPMLCINKDALLVFNACDGMSNITSIIELCSTHNDMSFREMSKAVSLFIAELERLGLVELKKEAISLH